MRRGRAPGGAVSAGMAPSSNSTLRTILILGCLFQCAYSGYLEARYWDEIERDPLVVLHGVGGASMEMKLRDAEPESDWCRKNTLLWQTAWVLPRHMIPSLSTCLMENLTPVYQPWNCTWGSRKGVEIRVKHFGTLEGLMNLGPEDVQIWLFNYMKVMGMRLTRQLGYTFGKDLFGAPYDWRFTPDALDSMGYFIKLKALVETAYATSGGRRVHIMGHSLGSQMALAFLNRMDREWKRKYIATYMPVGGPFAGNVMNVMGIISGYDLGTWLSPKRIRGFEAACPSGSWLLPDPEVFGNEVLVETPSRTYTAYDFEQLFTDLGLNETREAFPYVRAQKLAPPDVDTHLIYSLGLPTVYKLVYDEDFQPGVLPESPEALRHDDGDGTVPCKSLERPLHDWHPDGSWTLQKHVVYGSDHMNIINSWEFFDILTSIIVRGPGLEKIKAREQMERAIIEKFGIKRYSRPS